LWVNDKLIYNIDSRRGAEPEVEKPKPKKESATRGEDDDDDDRARHQSTLEALVRFRRKSGGLVSEPAESSDKMKDENAVNREIAALLLNLHASRGAPKPPAPQKPEDLSLKSMASNEAAMDLTKSKSTTSPATITKLVKSHAGGVDLSGKNNKSAASTAGNAASAGTNLPNFTLPTAPTSYPFYSSLATMAGMTPSLAMNSNYLLQNLLLGKMQQIVSASSGSSAAPASVVTAKTSPSSVATLSLPATSLPTQPLPAQSLTMPTASAALKPPPAVLKTTSLTNGSSALNFSNPMTLTGGVGGETTTTTVTAATAASIPLLCGQIVSQLNGLLFLVHGINSPALEMNLQTQLTAIHTRLQDIVTTVEHAKKSDPDLASEKGAKDKQKDEEKLVAKHIQEYQRALLKQHDDKSGKGHLVDLPDASPNDSMELQEAESTSGYLSAAARRRRGRPPKNSNLDLSYSPPEKQMRSSSSGETSDLPPAQNGESHHSAVNGNHGLHAQNGGAAAAGGHGSSSGKSSKGIRNRVFCGECVGCLKNDDCGKCRYCKDKTKFGGQNRLRQKCLHRRCQVAKFIFSSLKVEQQYSFLPNQATCMHC
jgi:hypothetical protein